MLLDVANRRDKHAFGRFIEGSFIISSFLSRSLPVGIDDSSRLAMRKQPDASWLRHRPRLLTTGIVFSLSLPV